MIFSLPLIFATRLPLFWNRFLALRRGAGRTELTENLPLSQDAVLSGLGIRRVSVSVNEEYDRPREP